MLKYYIQTEICDFCDHKIPIICQTCDVQKIVHFSDYRGQPDRELITCQNCDYYDDKWHKCLTYGEKFGFDYCSRAIKKVGDVND